jgi:23S rRNA (cytosine1962-C5)-methyltransferase
MNRLTLRPGHDRRLRSGHPWVFSNEIASLGTGIQDGCDVEIISASGEFLGCGYYNSRSLIAARLLSRQRSPLDDDFFRTRIATAATYRTGLYPENTAVRLVHGESDGLPGLVVDRYGPVLSVQLLTLGMDMRRAQLIRLLQELFAPQAIVLRNDVAVRELEGLEQQVEVAAGALPGELVIDENGLSFAVDVLGGQKTGQFLDQKENHLALQGRVAGRRVLDLFCYAGSWALHAAHFGAAEVLGIDISNGAVALCRKNAALNGLEQRCRFERADVFDFLRDQGRSRERYGAIVLDPPAFVKSKKRLDEVVKGYLTVNRRAFELLDPGGYLFSCSCSYHMERELFLETLRKAAAQAGRDVRLLELRGQAYDHPVLLACPETDYLKCAVLQVT